MKRLSFAERYPVIGAVKVLNYAEAVFQNPSVPRCEMLIIQSFSDNVSSFNRACSIASRATKNVDFITIHGLKHYFLLDLDSKSVTDTMLTYFDLIDVPISVDVGFLERVHAQVSEEHLFWAHRLFQLIIAFFTVFGIFLTQTLPDVLEMKPSAPYFLLSYNSIILIYALLASMYYFFMLRTQIYLIFHVEPFFAALGFQKYKISRSIAGKSSTSISKHTSFAIFFIPFFSALFSFIQFLIVYYDRITLVSDNSLIIFWISANMALLVLSVRSGLMINKYAKIKLYSTPSPVYRNERYSKALSLFYTSLR